MKRTLTLLTVLFITSVIVAQSINKTTDSVVQKLYWYALKNPSASLFVHFDKNVYINNENVWFTGYLLNNYTGDVHHTMSVALIRNDDRSVLAEGRFVFNKKQSFGNLFLPDSLPTGNYSFVCYTNHVVNGYPSALFIQPVTIKTADANGFITKLSLIDSLRPGMDSARVLLKSYTQDIRLVRGADVSYYIGDRSKPLKSGKLKTDNFGEAKIAIPLKEITGANNVLQTEVNNGKEVKTFSIRLPVYNKEIIVKFYPEGGSLVQGIASAVGWEVMNNEGEPMMISGKLYNNDEVVETVQTNAYGMGKFNLTPMRGSRYSIKLNATAGISDTAYMLPAAFPAGPVINVADALTPDTLSFQLKNTQPGDRWVVMIHNYRDTYITSAVKSTGRAMILKVPLDDVPRGLNTITLLDSVGRPWAERLFFAHFDDQTAITISTDSASYSTRQKVTVRFKVADKNQTPLRSIVSIACVQDNRLEQKKMSDIASYTYLKNELASFPFKSKLMDSNTDNKEYLEVLMLVKGWRRYTWRDVAKVNAADTLPDVASLTFSGQASLKTRQTRRPLEVLVLNLPSIDLVNTDSSGHFMLTAPLMVTPPDKQLRLSLNKKKQDQYTIKLADPYVEMNKRLAHSLSFDHYDLASFSQTSQTVVLKNEEGAKRLLDVTVTTKKDNSIYAFGANACGDYVCMYGILNCTNHPFGGSAPVVGRRYGLKGTSMTIVYEGCAALEKETQKSVVQINGIYTAKEFYVADYAKFNPPAPDYLSTVYWNYSVLTNENGEAGLHFYTSDIAGRFRIVIQGIPGSNVVYGEHTFEVRKQ